VNIEYDTMQAEHKTETVEGFTSVIFQHEIDHLNGILYLDHLAKEVRDTQN
jgi:peptide deformylase